MSPFRISWIAYLCVILPAMVCSFQFQQSQLSQSVKFHRHSIATAPFINGVHHHRHHHYHHDQAHQLVDNKWSLSSNEKSIDGPNRKEPRQLVPRLMLLLRALLAKLLAGPSYINERRFRFSSLSKRVRMKVNAGLTAFGILAMVVGYQKGITPATVVQKYGQRVSVSRASSRKAMRRPVEVPYSTFMDFVEQSGKGHTAGRNPAIQLSQMTIGKERIGFRVEQDAGKHEIAMANQKLVTAEDISVKEVQSRIAYTTKVNASPDLIHFLRRNDIPFQATSQRRSSLFFTLARSSIFFAYMLFLLRMYRTMSGGGGGGLGGSSDVPGKLAGVGLGRRGRGKKADDAREAENRVTFDDIEGIDDAKFEVMALADALRNPGKYSILGARAPTGLLLEGPPGTGKTMLAKACATTAGVPLLYCSGSDFVEMFVGRGAARVRKTFERAGKIAPCIVFIDELDALGKSRSGGGIDGFMGGAGGGRSNDEAEQTLNQLLTCMDGLDSTRGICVLAATNRKDVLDPALIRPGRFDRLVKVRLPDVDGRERILRVHAKKLPGFVEGSGIDEKRAGSLGRGREIDLSAVAAITPGLSGAELEFIVNEAAIRAVRRVSQALRENKDPDKIVPQVNAMDFEESLRNYYETRKGAVPGGKMSDVLNNVLRPRGV